MKLLKNCNDILVTPDTPILKALRIIDDGAMQIAIVTDEENRLVGTVTDGDVRRGILRGITLDMPVQEIMNVKPAIVRQNELRENVLALMKERTLHHIPVVDETGFVVGLEVLDELIRERKQDNLVVLMAGGLGSRLQPLTADCPKPLLKVGGKPVMETIICNFKEYGFSKFYISVNYKSEMITEYFGDGSKLGVNIKYIYEDQRMGTAGALGLLPEKTSIPVLVMNGDVLTKINFRQLLDFHLEYQAQGTMCVREYNFQVPYGVVEMDKHRLLSINEKPVQRFFVNAGIYVLDPKAIELIPHNKFFDMPSLFDKLIEHNSDTAVFPIREYWLDIGQMKDYEKANGEFSEVFK